MRLFSFLLILTLSVTFASCFDELTSISNPDFGPISEDGQYERQPAQPSDLVGQQFGMAEVTLLSNGQTNETFSMEGCLLSVLEDRCDTDCDSRIDEGGSSIAFTNSYYNRAGTEFDGIRFFDNNSSSSGIASFFLQNEVLPLLLEADWVVEREGPDFILTCTDCEINRFGTVSSDRQIRLSR